ARYGPDRIATRARRAVVHARYNRWWGACRTSHRISKGGTTMTSRVALVTGGTGGIGTAICKRLAQMGHKVATNYRDEAKAKTWQADLERQGIKIAIVPGDVSTPEGGAAIAKAVEQALGPVDILVNNAGITR